ncbi:hypothetical protein M0R45_030637 [Rubus argutus]|uniref:Thaumatin-like protein n=1 Tax=Rubus argutus TaxID=59490 RepID=A0AAW1WFQ2_RUBAR
MMKIQVLLYHTFIFLFFPGAHPATIYFTNNCPYMVWPATLTADQKPQLALTGFKLPSGASTLVDTPPRGLRFRSGLMQRKRRNSAGDFVEMNIVGCGGKDFYDVSLVDGFNLPVSVTPLGGNGDCWTSSCRADVNAICPNELQSKRANGSVVGCKSACTAFHEPKYCCTPPNDKPETCPPTDYSSKFSQQCPDAYSYAYDDKKGTFTCSGGPNYAITFCP